MNLVELKNWEMLIMRCKGVYMLSKKNEYNFIIKILMSKKNWFGK